VISSDFFDDVFDPDHGKIITKKQRAADLRGLTRICV
jgi:hypothetical protein